MYWDVVCAGQPHVEILLLKLGKFGLEVVLSSEPSECVSEENGV